MGAAKSLGWRESNRSRPEGPDPRLLQLAFAIICVFSSVAKWRAVGEMVPGLFAGLVVVVLVTLGVAFVRGRLSVHLFILGALVDLVAVGLIRTAPDAGGLGMDRFLSAASHELRTR